MSGARGNTELTMTCVCTGEFIVGLSFASGLVVSGMARPSKVAAFMDVASGGWDLSLAFVMGNVQSEGKCAAAAFPQPMPTPAPGEAVFKTKQEAHDYLKSWAGVTCETGRRCMTAARSTEGMKGSGSCCSSRGSPN